MIPVPTLSDLAAFSGRPEASYTGYATSALLQAALQFTILSELTPSDYDSLDSDSQTLAQQGMVAMADWVYLRQPYQQAIASPMLNETIGSYSYGKPPPVEMRNVQAQELGASSTGIVLWDLALQILSKRRAVMGVYSGQIMGFERDNNDRRLSVTALRVNRHTGQVELLGPEDFDKYDIPFSINAEAFPSDPA